MRRIAFVSTALTLCVAAAFAVGVNAARKPANGNRGGMALCSSKKCLHDNTRHIAGARDERATR